MAQYELQELNLPTAEGRRVVYPRIVLSGQCTLDDMVEQLTQSTTFTPGDVRGLISALADEMARALAQGKSVKIDDLGVFTPAARLREEAAGKLSQPGAKRIVAGDVAIARVHFRPARRMVALANERCRMERSGRKFQRSSVRFTPAERLKMAQDYLDTHAYLTVADYGAMTGLLHSAAAAELLAWSRQEGSGIAAKGLSTHKVYVKKD